MGKYFCYCSAAQLCPILCDPMDCNTPGFPFLHHLPESAQTHVYWGNDVIQPSHPLSPLSPPALNLYSIRVFSNESALYIKWPKYRSSSSASVLQMNIQEMSISFKIDWFALLAVQRTLKSLLQHNNSKAAILLHLAFPEVQLSHPYMATGKTTALTRWTFVNDVLFLIV